MNLLSLIFQFGERGLSLIAWAEVLFIAAMVILHYVGRSSVRRNPDDYVYHFARVWWATFRRKPSPVSRPRMIDADPGDEEKGPLMDLIDEDAIAALGEPKQEATDDEAGAGEGVGAGDEQSAPGMRVATLTVRVIPQSGNDEVVGWMGRALKIRVTAAAEGGQANKALIELLSSTLGVRPHQIQLKRGHYEEQKVLQFSGLSQSELEERLAAFS